MTTENQSVDTQVATAEQFAHGVLKVETTIVSTTPVSETPAAVVVTQTGPAPVAAVTSNQVPTVPTTPALVPQPTPVKPDAPLLPEVEAILQKARAEATTLGKMVLNQIEEYINDMAPKKPMTPALGVRHQVKLYRALQTTTRLGDDFFLVWGTILKLFNSQRAAVFHESYVFRYMEHVTLSPQDQKAFQRLLNLIVITANPQGRAVAVKQVDFKRTLEFGMDEAGRNRLLGFYGV